MPVTGCDLLPTLCELAGMDKPLPDDIDGGSFGPLLRGAGEGQVKRPREEIIWHFPHYQKRGLGPHSAVLHGQYKLIELWETNEVRLFDLSRDIGERHDLASRMPEKAAGLRRRLREYLRTVGARMPVPNPRHDPSASEPGGRRDGRRRGKRNDRGGSRRSSGARGR